MSRNKRIISTLLAFSMIFSAMPVKALADKVDLNTLIPNANSKEVKNNGKIITELSQYRTRNTKTFLKDDMTYETDIYGDPVHYLSDGIWKDIDNTLNDGKDEDNNDILSNKDNDYKVKFAKTSKAKNLVRIQKDKYEISWGIDNSNTSDSKPNIETKDISKLNTLSANEQKKTLTNLSSTIDFDNAFNDTDLKYTLKPEEVKENIVIKTQADNPIYSFNLNTKGLIPKLSKDNSITFFDDKNTSQAVFKMNAPFMYDANGINSDKVTVTLTKDKDQYKLTITPDNNWLNDSKRAYPVTIDPPVSTSLDVSSIQDSFVGSSLPNQNNYQSTLLGVGQGSASGTTRSFIKFQLPYINSADLIINAVLNLSLYSSNSTLRQINVHKVTQDWNSNTITWNNQPQYDNSKIEDYQLVQGNAGDYFNWDITNIAKQWYSTGNNYGLMIKSDYEGAGYNEFFASDTSSAYAGYRPQVSISYINNSGLEDFWTYHSQDMGRAGVGYVNDYNGNAIFVHDDMNMSGNRMPVSIKHVFNSNDKGTNIGYGYGWRLNLNQTVTPLTISGQPWYQYIDEDGTKHYFYYDLSSGKYKDELTSDLTLVVNSDRTYTIRDKKDNLLIFTPTGYLNYIKDSNGNTETLGYNGSVLSTITDGAGRVTTLTTNQYGFLIGITDPAQRLTNFSYTGAQLTKIIDSDNNYSQYNYDGNNNMLTANTYDGYKLSYTYGTQAPYRVTKMQEGNTNGTIGQSLNITYGYNTTTFIDAKGTKNTYQFNNSGQTVSIKADDGSAQYYNYDSGQNINKLSLESKLQKTTKNYLRNHNAENSDGWAGASGSGSLGSSNFSTDYAYIGKQSLKINKTNNSGYQVFSQPITLQKGNTYTFSAYVKASNISSTSGQGAYIYINYQDSTGAWKSISSGYINGTKDWQRIEVKVTYPSDALSTSALARVGVTGEQGTAYFDCLQLEDGSIANRYNIIENSDFSFGSGTPDYWSKNANCDSSDTMVTTIDATHPKPMDSNRFLMYGSTTKSKSIYQVINTSGSTGNVYSFGGWVLGASVPLNSGRYFKMDVGFKNSADGTYHWTSVNFNQDSSDWQFASNVAVADCNYSSIAVYIDYGFEANWAYFDGIQLYKEEFGASYVRDPNSGNIRSVSTLSKQSFEFTYDSSNNMTSSKDPNNNITNYTYDTSHNMTSSTSPENVVSTFGYDSYGNPTNTKLGDSTTFMQSSSAYATSGNYLKSLTDSSGNTVNYNYDETKGTLSSITDARLNTTSYGYDGLDRLTSVSKNIDGTQISNNYTYQNDKLQSVTSNGLSYNFGYDSLGNNTTVSVGTQNFRTNIYDLANGTLTQSTYGNGQTIKSDYDSLGRITDNVINGIRRYDYQYDAAGNLGYEDELDNNGNITKSYRYLYDISDRLTQVNDNTGNTTTYNYDLTNNLSSLNEKINGASYTTGYSYDKDNKQTSMSYTRDSSNNINYTYDTLARKTTSTINTGSATFNTTYSYKPGVNGATTSMVSSISNNGATIGYTYDANGDIDTITNPDGTTIKYYYNEANELKREDNKVLNKTIVYAYDAGGNITSKTEYAYTTDINPTNPTGTFTYSYGDTNWKDKLTAYNGKSIGYDAIGNTLSYDKWTYSWDNGRELSSAISTDGQNISYKYNSSGIRTAKIVNGITTSYHLSGNKVTYEDNGTDKIYYTYDSYDNLVSMNLNGVEYYYIKNAQGDIIGIFDKSGTQVVSYNYDSWGKLISITGSLASTVGAKNPYRYRGYRYDTETGLYYLQSRYYNSEWTRFINVDNIDAVKKPGSDGRELLIENLFAYCGNNPIVYTDPSGQFGMKDVNEFMIRAELLIFAPIIKATYELNTSFHAVQRMLQREISREQVEDVLSNGAKYYDEVADSIIYYKDRIAVAIKNGNITTIYDKADFKYWRWTPIK